MLPSLKIFALHAIAPVTTSLVKVMSGGRWRIDKRASEPTRTKSATSCLYATGAVVDIDRTAFVLNPQGVNSVGTEAHKATGWAA